MSIDGHPAADGSRPRAGKPRVGRHPVNQPMIDHWARRDRRQEPDLRRRGRGQAAGHPGIVAPPAMIQVWTMMGLGGVRPDDDPLGKILNCSTTHGYIGVVATNCEQTYHRYLRPGEEVSISRRADRCGRAQADRAG